MQYSGKDVEGIEDKANALIGECMKTIDRNWTSELNDTKIFDISRMIQYLTMDVITQLLFGDPFGDVRTQSDVYGLLKMTRERLATVGVMALFPELYSLLLFISYIPLLKGILPNRRDKHGIGRAMEVGRLHNLDDLRCDLL